MTKEITGGTGLMFSEGLPVSLIMTPRSDFRTCQTDELIPDIIRRNNEQFDFFPVVKSHNGREQIIGLLDLKEAGEDFCDEPVEKQMYNLTESELIGSDANIISFIHCADDHGCRLVISGQEITGLVTLFDMQKLPVRAALFAIITQLEIKMTEHIRKGSSRPDEWLSGLSEGRREKLLAEIAKSKENDSYVDGLLFTQFSDKTIPSGPICLCQRQRKASEWGSLSRWVRSFRDTRRASREWVGVVNSRVSGWTRMRPRSNAR